MNTGLLGENFSFNTKKYKEKRTPRISLLDHLHIKLSPLALFLANICVILFSYFF